MYPVDHRITAKVNILIFMFSASIDAYVYRRYAGFSNEFSDFNLISGFDILVELF